MRTHSTKLSPLWAEAAKRARTGATANRKGDLTRFRDDPVGLSTEVFGLRLEFDGYTKQADLCRAVARHSRVACRSGHKTGKTLSIALLAWWFALTRPGCRVVCTHPTARQIKQTVWREISAIRSRGVARGWDLPQVPLDPATGINFPNGAQILGFTVEDPDAFSGISAPEVLYLVDEASGVKEEVFEAIKGNLAGGGKLVETGNPTNTSGHFYEDFHDKRNLFADGALLHIASTESPNVLTGSILVPGLATAEWAADMAAEYGGPGEPVWDVRVGGDFPKAGPNTVVPLVLLEGARDRWDDGERDSGSTVSLGVDVARFGDDDTVIAYARGTEGGILETIHGAPVPEVASAAVRAARSLRKSGITNVRIAIDEGGIGAGVVDLVSAEFNGERFVTVVGISASERAQDEQKFDRVRDEMWWLIREWLPTAALAPCSELEREIVAPIYAMTPSAKIKVESQENIKKRLKRSPDHANALGLALAAVTRTVDLSPAREANRRIAANTALQSRWGAGAMAPGQLWGGMGGLGGRGFG